VPIQKSANLVETKAREKFSHWHMVDIPRIQFFGSADIDPPSAGRTNWPFMDGHYLKGVDLSLNALIRFILHRPLTSVHIGAGDDPAMDFENGSFYAIR
jgi:hypothetical protein